ncbi:Ldh family oxidoreductase [Rhodococcus sp. Eu-32]|nr:Ldh family oxidoreductase [Rhodococcus sp. Eu-32]
MKLTIDEARNLAQHAMQSCGHSSDEATIIADHLLDCELRGLSFGGLARALSVIERRAKSPQSPQSIKVIKDTPVSATLHGGDQVGYLVAKRATDIAIDKARRTGIAVVGAHKTWYTGMFSYYLEMITAAGYVGMIAGSGNHLVAPHGGTRARFGTNPIAFGFPTETHPVIWDIGTAAVMLGEVMLKNRLGEALPEGLAYAPDGTPTQDPAQALAGAFTVWGGHKGSGLALVVQLLGMLAGAQAEPDGLTDCGLFILVVDPAVLTDAPANLASVSNYAQSVRETRPVDPSQPVRVPFDRSQQRREQTMKIGHIDIDTRVFDALTAIISTQQEQDATS